MAFGTYCRRSQPASIASFTLGAHDAPARRCEPRPHSRERRSPRRPGAARSSRTHRRLLGSRDADRRGGIRSRITERSVRRVASCDNERRSQHGGRAETGAQRARNRVPGISSPVRRRLPPGARYHAASKLAATTPGGDTSRSGGGDGSIRRSWRSTPSRRGARLRLVDSGHDRALGRGRELLPPHRGRGGRRLIRAHPDVRLARGRGRNADGEPAREEAGCRCRGSRHRRRLRLQALRAGAGNVHAPR